MSASGARHGEFDTPLGRVRLTRDGDALSGLHFDGQKYHPGDVPGVLRDDDDPLLQAAARQLAEYVQGTRRAFELPLRPRGTPFQQRVWAGLLAIPYGCTLSYRALAVRIGAPAAVRAVGAAVGRNPLSVVVPCHRMLGSGGALTGYAGGLERKRALLALEARVLGDGPG